MVRVTSKAKGRLRNLVMVDDRRLDDLVAQLPTSLGILENVRAKFGLSLRGVGLQLEPKSLLDLSTIKKIRKLETYLGRNTLINKMRPRRMPHGNVDGKSYWWVKETFLARKVHYSNSDSARKVWNCRPNGMDQ
jgi:hypothetical protein